VLTTIPFAAMGAMWTLYLTGTVMDAIGWVGIIVLVGVVVNNGIVLVDKIHKIRRSGKGRDEAVLAGAAARVRPIMMTALTTVFGLLPMAIGDGVGANEGIDYRALATCVAGGLAFSTVFTLWVVPLAYTVIDDVARGLMWLVRRSLHAGPIEGQARELAGAGGGAGAARDREE
jgi:HAE1 family hydrophobic/amphiphilic exporter-1